MLQITQDRFLFEVIFDDSDETLIHFQEEPQHLIGGSQKV